VICVTHLPQVAVYAKHQWTIRKTTKAKRTATTIQELATEDDRLEEIASMMRGEARSDTTRREAQEMLKSAKKKW
jgi:DNA repair protein RecN (Recombination protein N)